MPTEYLFNLIGTKTWPPFPESMPARLPSAIKIRPAPKRAHSLSRQSGSRQSQHSSFAPTDVLPSLNIAFAVDPPSSISNSLEQPSPPELRDSSLSVLMAAASVGEATKASIGSRPWDLEVKEERQASGLFESLSGLESPCLSAFYLWASASSGCLREHTLSGLAGPDLSKANSAIGRGGSSLLGGRTFSSGSQDHDHLWRPTL